jgi:3',5'-cyclic AMP phosphodiesterase CpdA
MKKIASKEIFIKVIILSVIIMVASSSISGCRANRDVTGAGLKDTVAEQQQTGFGDSGPAESEPQETTAGNENNPSSESGSNSQANGGNGTSIGTESSSQAATGDDTAVAPESSTGSDTTVDENKILFTFVISGDNRPANNENPQPEVFIKLLKYMKQQNPSIYINTGDIIMGNTENENVIKRQFSDYLEALKNLGVLNFVAPGNHDVANSMSEKYFLEWVQKPAFNNAGSSGIKAGAGLPGNELPGGDSQETANNEAQLENGSTKNRLYYYLEYKGVYFVIINTYEKGYWGQIQGDQLFWLGQLLEKLKDKPVFVFLHPPVYSVMNPECITDGSLHVAFSSKENQDYIRSLFARYKVDGVFCGHEHFYNKQEHDGVQYIITGCSGASPYAPKDEGGFNHFVKMQVKAKSWIMDVIDSSGNKVYTEEILFN